MAKKVEKRARTKAVLPVAKAPKAATAPRSRPPEPAAGFLNAREVAVLAGPLIQAASREIKREREVRVLAEPEAGGGRVLGPLWFVGGVILGAAAMAVFTYLRQSRVKRELVTLPGDRQVAYSPEPVRPE